ncbi:MAG: NYN domain-containing protein [Candidatus Gracilibacteria bacterium]|nr:NYN domain-containing protein [Candidatus Gracilibacteria bacterium]
MTIIKHPNQRVAVLIDTNNLYHSARSLYGQRVNFAELLEQATAGRELVRAIAYVVKSDSPEEDTFFEALNDRGIETKTKDLQVFFDGTKKGDWDVGITLDAIRLAPRLDAIVLASGDGDYIPLVEHLKSTFGVQVEVIAFGRTTSGRIKEAVDEFIDMDMSRDMFLIGRPSRGGGSSGGRKNTRSNG